MVNVSRDAIATLTTRERDCLRLVRRGRGTAEIAEQLNIGIETVQSHIKSARRKLGGLDRYRAARLLDAFEMSPHPVVSDEMGMAAIDDAPPSEPAFHHRAQDVRTVYDAPTFPQPVDERAPAKDRRHDLTLLKRLTMLLAIAALIAITIVAAKPMGESFQDLANLIDPPTR